MQGSRSWLPRIVQQVHSMDNDSRPTQDDAFRGAGDRALYFSAIQGGIMKFVWEQIIIFAILWFVLGFSIGALVSEFFRGQGK